MSVIYESSPSGLPLKKGTAVGLAACSDILSLGQRGKIEELKGYLRGLELEPVESPCLYGGELPPDKAQGRGEKQRAAKLSGDTGIFSRTAGEKARALMDFYKDPSVGAIFDLSGGDLANEILDFLDFDLIRANPKPLFGYSDVTAVLNAVSAVTGQETILYQARNLVGRCAKEQQAAFADTIVSGGDALFEVPVRFRQGNFMEGVLAGGNIRCLLKLAGTPYLPDFQGKLLFLEGRSGGPARVAAHLAQLRQMGVFRKISGLLLGTFTELELKKEGPELDLLVMRELDHAGIPVAYTPWVGHGPDSRALRIGARCTVQQG